MGRVEGKVAFVTGAARGQGRSHAIRLAEEGADIIAVDVPAPIESVNYSMATSDDLQQTVKEVEALGRRIIATQTDVRDYPALKAAVDDGVAQLGRLDIVVANAGISNYGRAHELEEQAWQDMIDVNLTGVWHSVKAAVPHLKAGGNGGAIILISSSSGFKAYENLAHYTAAKHGVVGLMKSFGLELAKDFIRVNSIHPGGVDTEMIHNPESHALFMPDLEEHERTREIMAERILPLSVMPVPWVDPRDISNAVLWLASDEARFVTGAAIPVDAGTVLA